MDQVLTDLSQLFFVLLVREVLTILYAQKVPFNLSASTKNSSLFQFRRLWHSGKYIKLSVDLIDTITSFLSHFSNLDTLKLLCLEGDFPAILIHSTFPNLRSFSYILPVQVSASVADFVNRHPYITTLDIYQASASLDRLDPMRSHALATSQTIHEIAHINPVFDMPRQHPPIHLSFLFQLGGYRGSDGDARDDGLAANTWSRFPI
jgi:hypothetical protein